ncbi:DUF998 domain-containing protein [Arthrobacter yangruifuii]|uniref:DUF998 domain-containing protein n=1 Tax=Arthrobacter yangruifuii TaxID=2606616 RepID=UPI001647BF83|nr:DUF998 domain-containing protein [Arthrobacter yangruifuii]
MTRLRLGAALWTLCLLTFPTQVIAAAQWPNPYSWSSNFISDLGVTSCRIFDAGTRVERYICSPGHLLANGSTIANGALMAVGAILLWSVWPRQRTGKTAMFFLAAGGLLVMLVGFLAWDIHPGAHDAVALAQALMQWIGMAFLAFALKGSTAARWASALTMASLALSIAGFVLFIDAISGGPSISLGLGVTERLAFDTLTIWGAVLGVILLMTTLGHRSTTSNQEAISVSAPTPSPAA